MSRIVRPQVEQLECREVPTANIYNSADGQLVIVSDGDSDSVVVSERLLKSGSKCYDVEVNGVARVKTFFDGQIFANKIWFQGLGGNDYFQNKDAHGLAVYAEGNDGDDHIIGDVLTDTMQGGLGNDTLEGWDGGDKLDGEGGDDVLRGQIGPDTLFGGDGNDTLLGADQGDQLYAGSGDDYLEGNSGDDTLFGNNGNDKVYGFSGKDALNGGSGNDTLYGGDQDDELNGNEDDDLLDGGKGADTLSGSVGKDTLWGGLQNDTLLGEAGDDYLEGQQGDDSMDGGAGNDSMYGFSGKDNMHGADGDDTMNGGSQDDLVDGGVGNDTLNGWSGNDNLYGGDHNDTIFGGSGNDQLNGEAGNDRLLGEAGKDSLSGGDGYDVLDAGSKKEVALGDGDVDVNLWDWAKGGPQITAIQQGSVGVCQMLASAGAPIDAGRGQQIANLITYKGNNKFEVKLYKPGPWWSFGSGQWVKFNVNFDGSTMYPRDPGLVDDQFWVVLIQRAYASYFGKDYTQNWDWDNDNPGCQGAIEILGGKKSDYHAPWHGWGIDDNQDKPIVAATVLNPTSVKVVSNHAYVLLERYADESVLLYNPWGRDQDNGWNDGNDDGFITLSWDEFKDNFAAYFVLKG